MVQIWNGGDDRVLSRDRQSLRWTAFPCPQALGAPERKIFRIVRAPASLPFLFSGLRIGTTLALVGATVGEWVGASRGLGYLMIQANARLRMDRVFAAILLLTLLGLGLFWALSLLERLTLQRR